MIVPSTEAWAHNPVQDILALRMWKVGASAVQGLPSYEEILRPGYMRLLLKTKQNIIKISLGPNHIHRTVFLTEIQSIHRTVFLTEDSLSLSGSGVCHLSPYKFSLSLFKTSNGAR